MPKNSIENCISIIISPLVLIRVKVVKSSIEIKRQKCPEVPGQEYTCGNEIRIHGSDYKISKVVLNGHNWRAKFDTWSMKGEK